MRSASAAYIQLHLYPHDHPVRTHLQVHNPADTQGGFQGIPRNMSEYVSVPFVYPFRSSLSLTCFSQLELRRY